MFVTLELILILRLKTVCIYIICIIELYIIKLLRFFGPKRRRKKRIKFRRWMMRKKIIKNVECIKE